MDNNLKELGQFIFDNVDSFEYKISIKLYICTHTHTQQKYISHYIFCELSMLLYKNAHF